MLTSADLDKDPQLKGMLWDDVVSALDTSADHYDAFYSEAAKSVVESLSNVFTVYFARHPNVDALAFSLTNAEYDDEGYGGYNFTEVRPRFIPSSVTTPDALDYISEFADYAGGFVETRFYSYGRHKSSPDELTAAMNEANELDRLLGKVRNFAERAWGDCGVIVTREKISRYGDSEELDDWASKR